MLVTGSTEDDVRTAAASCGLEVHNLRRTDRGVRFTIRRAPGETRWRRLGYVKSREDGERYRLGRAVCWHGHYAFMDRLLRLSPEAVIETAIATYRGLQNFLATAEDTYTPDRDACTCVAAEET